MGWYQQVLTKFKGSEEADEVCTNYSQLSKGLSEHCKQLEMLYQTAPVGLGYLDLDLRIVYINDWLAQKSSRRASELIGLTLREVVPHIAPELEKCCRQVIKTGQPIFNYEISTKMPAHPKFVKHYLGSYYPIFSGDHQITGVSAVVQDVTVLKQAERVLWLSEQRYRTLVDKADSVVVCLDPVFRIIEWNHAAEKLYGQKRADVLGMSFQTFFPSDASWQLIAVSVRKVLNCETTEEVEDVLKQDGQENVVRWSFACLQDMNKQPYGAIVIGHDITTHRRLETKLHNARTKLKGVIGRMRTRYKEHKVHLTR